MLYDALIVGGGPAGLNAALVLGRARRSVLVIDDARPRNAVVDTAHGFLTREGISPARFLSIARSELSAYPGVRFLDATAANAIKQDDRFVVSLASGDVFEGKRLLLTTGVFDELPQVRGLRERWGKCVFVCPFCDGWDIRDQRIAVYGNGRDAVELAQEIRGWTHDIVVCVAGDDLTGRDRSWLDAAHVPLHVGTLRSLSGSEGSPLALTLENDTRLTCHALFISTELRQHSPLFAALGCKVGPDGLILVDGQFRTSVDGCYAAGDAVTKRHQIVIAAASGATAAITLNCNLLEAEAVALSSL